jgi:hypothetical protein
MYLSSWWSSLELGLCLELFVAPLREVSGFRFPEGFRGPSIPACHSTAERRSPALRTEPSSEMIKMSMKMIISITKCAYIAQNQSLAANKKDPASGVFLIDSA